MSILSILSSEVPIEEPEIKTYVIWSISITLNHVMTLDRARQDLKLCLRGNTPVVTFRTLEPSFKIYVKIHDFFNDV